ncbi:hypothetical protein IMZ48_26415 [Candidatus Bathyarchaeota archaeon]|nr:hypothetical protein [Candidatus Bathyarchaeota archaeon]
MQANGATLSPFPVHAQNIYVLSCAALLRCAFRLYMYPSLPAAPDAEGAPNPPRIKHRKEQ